MRAAEIRERFLSFFERNGHLRVSWASLVRSSYAPTVLLPTAGMQPLKPYFRGEEEPPRRRLTSCQKSFRTVDIEVVGTTLRHLTFFEMLGNFSVGEYFKKEAVGFALDLSTSEEYGFGLDFEDIWITVFGGDEELGLGPDGEAIEHWRAIGVPDERIILLGRDDNFWQSGPTGPCGPCSELYLDRGPEFGPDTDRPGDDTERFLEFWNLVFMQYELQADGSLPELPTKNIDTGMGLERMASILQNVPSVYETDLFRPLIELGEELSGKKYGDDVQTTRALRIIADHGRGATFLLADGVVPSNEDRGYILRRIMRRAIQQGHVLGVDQPLLVRVCERVRETMKDAYPELEREWPTIERWARAEEESFSRTLEQGERLLTELIERAKADNTSWVSAEDAFKLHDTYGFPYEMTKELLAEEGLSVDDQGFEELMERAREVSRATRASAPASWATRRPRRTPCCAPRSARTAGCSPSWRRARSIPRAAARSRTPGWWRRRPAARAWWTCTGSATTRRSRWSRWRASSARGRPCAPSWNATAASRPCATTPRRTFCTPRFASVSARTCARRAPTSARTSCASTSPTVSGCRPRTWPSSSGAWAAGSRRTAGCVRSRPPGTRPSASGRWRSSVRSTASACGWWRSTACRGSCAAARTWRRRRRSGCST